MSLQEDSQSRMDEKPLSDSQIEKLEKVYDEKKWIPKGHREELAEELNVTERQIKDWFEVHFELKKFNKKMKKCNKKSIK